MHEKLVYRDICAYFNFDDTCSSFNKGIVTKGIYNTMVKYWQQLRQLNLDFSKREDPLSEREKFLTDPRIVDSEIARDIYLKEAYTELKTQLVKEIEERFASERQQENFIFVVYLLYILILFFFFWKGFVKKMLLDLWKAKSMLSVIPVELCFKIDEIRRFIYANSTSQTA